jgi:peroxiredoxin
MLGKLPRNLVMPCFVTTIMLLGSDAALMAADTRPPQVGSEAPDFALKDLQNKAVRLSELTPRGPVVVVVLRGYPGYQCPLCTRQVGDFIKNSTAFKARNAQVVFVYPGPAKTLEKFAGEFVANTKLPDGFHLVIDPDYGMVNTYALRWNAPKETAYPSTFVVGVDGKVTYAKVSKSHGDRADSKSILEALEVSPVSK